MIGGAPLNQHLADEWGADGYGDNAMEAARVAAAAWWACRLSVSMEA